MEVTRAGQQSDQIQAADLAEPTPWEEEMCTDRVFEDSGLCAFELARVLMVFAGDAMLPTRLWVKMDELRSQGARGCRIVQLRTSEGATTRWATKGRLRISSGKL